VQEKKLVLLEVDRALLKVMHKDCPATIQIEIPDQSLAILRACFGEGPVKPVPVRMLLPHGVNGPKAPIYL